MRRRLWWIALIASALLFTHSLLVAHYLGQRYVSDEVWYVDAARNILSSVFHSSPRDAPGANILVPDCKPPTRALAECNCSRDAVWLREDCAVWVPRHCAECVARALNSSVVVWGWVEGRARDLLRYWNLEHPPLAKYVIVFSMWVGGDRFWSWRLPEIVAGSITVYLVYEMCLAALGGLFGELVGVSAAFLTAASRVFEAMSAIAMLDVYVALFSVAAAVALFRRRPWLAIALIAVGFCFKFSVLLAAIPCAIYIARMGLRRVGLRALEALYFVPLAAFIAGVAVDCLVSAPIWLRIGFVKWFGESVAGAIKWHLSTKCYGSSCPPASTPIQWFLDQNPFPLYITKPYSLYAAPYAPLWIFALASCILFTALAFEKCVGLEPWSWLTGLLIGWYLIYAAGNHSLYSFYAAQLAPFVAFWVAWLALETARSRGRVWIEAVKVWAEAPRSVREAVKELKKRVESVLGKHLGGDTVPNSRDDHEER